MLWCGGGGEVEVSVERERSLCAAQENISLFSLDLICEVSLSPVRKPTENIKLGQTVRGSAGDEILCSVCKAQNNSLVFK